MFTAPKKNSLLCPNCRKLISRSEKACPYCRTSRPGAWWKNNLLTAGFSEPDQIINAIIACNVLMFALAVFLNPGGSNFSFSPFHFLSPSNKSLFVLGATGTVPIDHYHFWWSLLAANYLHGSLLHIIFNMIALRQLGPLVIREYGAHRMIAIYTLGGIGGFVLSYFAGVRFTIGASAAVCSLIGALLYYGKSRGGAYGQAVYSQIGGWALSIFIFGLAIPGINNWGHGGGMAAGALLGLVLGYKERRRETINHKFIAAGCLAATILILLWAVLKGIFSLAA